MAGPFEHWELEIAGVKVGMNFATLAATTALVTVGGIAASFGAMPGFSGFVSHDEVKVVNTTLEAINHKLDLLSAKIDVNRQTLEAQIESNRAALNSKIDSTAKVISDKAAADSRENRALTIRGNIIDAHARECDAIRGGNYPLAQAIASQIANLNDDYFMVSGRYWPMDICPK